jgi:hypothetical protein
MNKRKQTLPLHYIHQLHRVLEGDPVQEGWVLDYILHRWKAPSLLYLPPDIAVEILKRPASFLKKAKEYSERLHNQPTP